MNTLAEPGLQLTGNLVPMLFCKFQRRLFNTLFYRASFPQRDSNSESCNVAHDMALQLTAEGLVEQRLLQFVERGEFLLVDGFEGLGFCLQILELRDRLTKFR